MWNKYLDRITELEWIVKEKDKTINEYKYNLQYTRGSIYDSLKAFEKELWGLNDLLD